MILSFVLVGGLPPCGPHGFRFTPFDHFCTRNPVGYWSALHTCQPSDPIFKSYRIRFSLALSIIGSGGGYDRLPLQHLGSGGAAVTVNHSETGDISASYRFRTGIDLNYVKPTLYLINVVFLV